MGQLATLFTGPKPQRTPYVKPLPANAGKAEDLRSRQAFATGGGNSTILTSPLGLGINENASTTLLGS